MYVIIFQFILATALTAHNKNTQVSTGCIGKCITEVAIGVSVAVIFTVAVVAAIIMLVLKRFKRFSNLNQCSDKKIAYLDNSTNIF